jgi:Tfp pilus assembly protein PilV
MLLELLIAMVVLTAGLGGLLILLVGSITTDRRSGQDTSSTMIAEHVLEQISSQQANDNAQLTITDCTGAAINITTQGATKGAGNSGANGGNGANLTAAGNIDWTQATAGVPNGYSMMYTSCGAGGRQTRYEARWNVMTMTVYSRMIVVSARPVGSVTVGGLRYIVPASLRTIGGM